MYIKDIINYLDSYAPPAYQESYDNSGLIVGNKNDELKGAIITLDSTEDVVDEAVNLGYNLIIAHHPIIFSGLKKITGKNYVERTIVKAIKNDIAIYAIHTNLDNVHNGVNQIICDKLHLSNLKILSPKKGILKKLTVFTPTDNTENLLSALSKAGAGQIGNYEECSFQTEGYGTFKPNEKANPHIGKQGAIEKVAETRIEVIFPGYLEGQVLSAMRANHPYEEVAYYLHTLENSHQDVGSGMIGELKNPMDTNEFMVHLKSSMNLQVVRHTQPIKDQIRKIAVCGGSGSFLLSKAIQKQADIFITGDFKYHEFFDAENRIMIADIGHYESEVFTKDLLYEILKEKFTNIAVVCSKVNTNPIFYS